MDHLERLSQQWLSALPRGVEVAALIQDFSSLLHAAPVNPANLCRIARGHIWRLQGISDHVSALRGFLKRVIGHARRLPCAPQTVASPYLGGIEAKPVHDGHGHEPNTQRDLKVGCLNPGRCGLQTLMTNEILWWRLQHIMETLLAKDIAICFLPGARFPEGAAMPEKSPLQYLGAQTSQWGSIGVLVRNDALHVVRFLDDFITERTIWLVIDTSGAHGSPHDLILGGFYAAPGGDEVTWGLALQQFIQLQHEHPESKCFLLGDGNAHFTHIVDHVPDCRCSHCAQSPADRRIESLVRMAGLHPLNGPEPTHESGTTIDVILGIDGSPRAVTHDDCIGGSDHKLVSFDPFCSFPLRNERHIAVVQWAHPELWTEALLSVEPLLSSLTDSILAVDEEIQAATVMPERRKRNLLEACAWGREAVYAAIGHFSSAIAVKLPKPTVPCSALPRSAETCRRDHACLLHREQSRNLQKFADLAHSQPSLAQRFLSGLLNRSKAFSIALQDPVTHKPAAPERCAEIISRDLFDRTSGLTASEPSPHEHILEVVREIRRQRAPSTGVIFDGCPIRPPLVNTSRQPQPYSWAELQTCLTKIVASKKAVHCPMAALKAQCHAGQQLSLALCNLGRTCAMSPSGWGLRHIAPLRKAGPRMVTAIKDLRPISRASDLASLQDALWMGRCKEFLDKFTGHQQFGGKFDAVAIVVTLVLHAQLRQYQGLMTYLLFADLQQAFDMADWGLMLLTCYSAGIVGNEWLLLDDFFRQDRAAVFVSGFLSNVLRFSAGIPQGRRFSMHAFMSSMQVLRHTMDEIAETSRTVLPEFAREAMEGCWAHLTAPPDPNLVPLAPNPILAADAIQNCISQGDVSNARRLAIHSLNAMESFPDRVLCMERLGVESVGPLLFVDDVSAPYPDMSSVEAVLRDGLQKYANLARASFNYGPRKTATMACYDAPPAAGHTPVYKLLGVEVDSSFTFSKRLDIVCALGRSAFEEFFHMAETAGLSVPVEALEVPRRVEPVVLYGVELLSLATGAENRLNELQASWARCILGARTDRGVSARLSVFELGWKLRLGTSMLVKSVVFFNKILLLPDCHPAKAMLRLGLSFPCDSWATRVKAIMQDERLREPIPSIWQWGGIPEGLLQVASTDLAVRKNVLKRYKTEVVLPMFMALDQAAYEEAAARTLPGLSCLFSSLSTERGRLIDVLLSIGPELPWRSVRIWWLIRLTGKWPVPLFATGNCAITLPCCNTCGLLEIPVGHVLGRQRCQTADEAQLAHLCSADIEPQELQANILFVSSRVGEELSATFWRNSMPAEADEGRMEQWARDIMIAQLRV